MTQVEKAKFRHSDEWKDFRLLCKSVSGGVDFITGEPLQRGWELHHLDVTEDGYTKIKDVNDFVCLNSVTHTFLHYIYPKVNNLTKAEYDATMYQMFDRFYEVLSEMIRRERAIYGQKV